VKAATVKVELDEEGAPVETAEQSDAPPDQAKLKAKLPSPAAPVEQSAIMKQIQVEEDRSLKDWLDTIGTQGAFKIALSRSEPRFIQVRGRGQVLCAGFLQSYDHTISEEDIQRTYGGGTFILKVTRPGKTGSHHFQKGLQRTVQIAGEPNPDNLPGGANTAATEPAQGAPENPAALKEMTSLVKELIHDNRRPTDTQRGIDPAIQLLLDQNAQQLASRERELSTMRAEIAELRKASSAPAPSDPFRDKMMSSMFEGNAAQVEAIKIRTESELRQMKDGHLQEVKRLEDRHDRDMSSMRQSHELALASQKSSFEREIAAMRSAHEVSLGAAKAMFEVQASTLGAEVKRLERDNDELRRDVRELRERKDKGILEQANDVKKLKEALGADDEGGSSTVDQIMAALPALIEQGGKMLASRGTAPQAVQVQAVPSRPRIAKTPDGQRVMVQGDRIVPVQRKPRVVAKDDGTPVAAPVVDPNQVAMLVTYLENAYKSGQDPEIVAQSGRSTVPEEVLKWIRENDTPETSGVDLFMRRVANLPSTSPLSTQSGRNWIRKVGKALVGDQQPDAE
jgi:hypothetical protein